MTTSKDYRNSSGYVLSSPEYLTAFQGAAGSRPAAARSSTTPTTRPRGAGVGTIAKWDGTAVKEILRAEGTYSNNSTKGTPTLQTDLYGDWRKEIIWRPGTAPSCAGLVSGSFHPAGLASPGCPW
ncbi:hypothetical protein ETD86_18220 [Nonomuraea turkmeniaca]|uniref:Rhamnogalacturonan lyase family 11 C-terminal domain-containing protein n=1 Tax=Nonomuraea turkmeniaca TaxID=103838 RepID=A0A5S4FJ38_9ACTN|nr:hypothetical protein [Nonomuraea turkmeniaca]TMR20599.1 hypothetical protein ETD86_18220 [Nonomuraea turkmeniaca]